MKVAIYALLLCTLHATLPQTVATDIADVARPQNGNKKCYECGTQNGTACPPDTENQAVFGTEVSNCDDMCVKILWADGGMLRYCYSGNETSGGWDILDDHTEYRCKGDLCNAGVKTLDNAAMLLAHFALAMLMQPN